MDQMPEGEPQIDQPVEPEPREVYSLDELLDGITEENLHSETKTGAAVGNEYLSKLRPEHQIQSVG